MFSAYFPGFSRVRKVREILGVVEVFLGIKFRKDQGKEGQGFSAKSVQNARFCALLGALSGIGRNPTSCRSVAGTALHNRA